MTGTGSDTVLTLTWNDNSISETSFVVQNTTDGLTWNTVGTVPSPLDQPNIHGARTYADATYRTNSNILAYRIKAVNTVGYGGQFMSLAVESISAPMAVIPAPTALAATLLAGPGVNLTWTDNATTETNFVVERQTNGGTWVQIATAPALNNTGSVTYVDAAVALGNTYTYRVAAANSFGLSAYSNTATVVVQVPAAPSNFTAAKGANQGNLRRVVLTWTDNANNETGFTIQRATNATFTAGLNTVTVGANVTTLTQSGLTRNTNYYYRIQATNVLGPSTPPVNAIPFPIRTNP